LHNADLNLIYVDQSLLVVNKPAGLLSVPGRGADKQDCLSLRIRNNYPDALVVHRLDMATSGLIMFARGAEIQRRLSRMFREREIEKHYVALVEGKINPAIGEVNLPIAVDWPNRPMQKIDAETGKPSRTRYKLISHDAASNISRIELEPVTGRTHQLRVHLAAIGYPILGDALYQGPSADRLHLHAYELNFQHPCNSEMLYLNCPAQF
jgi:tRNA pseudouridine32 synthase/23S rRNA pseudouridine746 synthase